MPTIEEIEKRRAERREKHDKARSEQEAIDLEAIDALEAIEGTPLRTMTANEFTVGVPYRIAFRTPSPAEYKRYCDQVGIAKAKNDPLAQRKAMELLAAVCLSYPAKDSEPLIALLQASPGLLLSVGLQCSMAAELRAEDEGKG